MTPSPAPLPGHRTWPRALPLWPRSLSGRIVFILVAGMLAAQALTSTIWYDIRHGELTEVPTRVMAARVADTLRMLDAVAPDSRAAVVRAAGAEMLGAAQAPALEDETAENQMVRQLFENVIGIRLGRPVALRVQAQLLDDEDRPAGTWALLTSHAPSVHYHVLAQLADGQWLRFDATEDQSGNDPRPMAALADYLVRIYLLRILVVAAISLVAVRIAMQPLERLARAADRLGLDIHSPPLAVAGPQEVQKAAQAFNMMQRRLIDSIGERTRFLAAVSHDLRSPITRLRLRTELLPEGPVQEKFRHDLDEMEAMVSTTLDFIRGSETDTPMQMVDVNALVEGLRQDIEDMGGSIHVAGRALAPLRGFAQNLHRALHNVIENAVRYGGAARIQVDDGAQRLRITVSDSGPGIPESQLEQVFEPFFRIDAARSAGDAGFGLGLSITRAIVQAHGGSVTLRNPAGGGLEAVLVFPRAA